MTSIKYSIKKIQSLILVLYIALIMVDPTNMIFHFKAYMFVILMFVTFLTGRFRHYNLAYITLISLLGLCLISISTGVVLYRSDLSGTGAYFVSILSLIVFITISNYKIENILLLNFWCGLILSIFILSIFAGFVLGYLPSLYDWTLDNNSTIMIAKRDFLGFDTFMFFYKSMPFVFFAFIYGLRHKKYFSSLLIFASIFVGGSRTPILMSLLAVAYVITTSGKKFVKPFLFVFLFGSILYLLYLLLSPENQNDGDSLKFGIASDLLKQTSLFGHGVGSSYFTRERGFITTSEMAYFEMAYHYGIVFFPLVLSLFLLPFLRLFRWKFNNDVRDFAFAYLLYLVNAGTNPLLINSTGMYVFACALMIAAKAREEDRFIHSKLGLEKTAV